MALLDESTLARLHRLRMAKGRVQRTSARGERLSRQQGAGQEFAAHRPYTHGDDLRRVDWNVYGRLGQLFIKMFDSPGQLKVLIALDDAETMDFGEPGKWLAARRLAAAAGVVALTGSERVGFATLRNTTIKNFDGQGESRLLGLLDGLKVGSGQAGQGVAKHLRKHGKDSFLLLVSDFQQREAPLQMLSEARRQGVKSVAVSVASAEELNPTIDGLTRLQPIGEDGLKLRIDESVLESYRREVTAYRQAVQSSVLATGAAFIEVLSDQPLEPFIGELVKAQFLGRG
ncbi:MAG: DUF58 domain-containing protein [Planctomycetota bacterium]|jgi:uncharacterized protein (DUF58 family)